MSHVFDTAVCMAQKMAAPKQHITITMGGLPSVMKDMNINGQPHELSYITPDEASILKQLGGSGRLINGIPAYITGETGAEDAANAAAAEAAADQAAAEAGLFSEEEQAAITGIDPTGRDPGWGTGWTSKQFLKDAPPLSWKDKFRHTPIGLPEVLKGMIQGPAGLLSLAMQTLAGRGAEAATNTETVDEALSQGWTGSVGRSGPSTSPHSEDSFDADTMSEEDFKIIEEKAKEEKNKKSIMSKYFEDLLEDEEEEDGDESASQTGESTAGVDLSFLEGLPGDLQDILKTSYGEEIMNTGLPSVRKQGRMA